MTSKPVWIWLPGQTQPVQAGIFTLAGTAAIPLGSFAYDKAYVERPDRVALDERQLRGFRGTAKTTDYQGVFDILRDVTPEGFGLDMPLRRRRRGQHQRAECPEVGRAAALARAVAPHGIQRPDRQR